MSLVLYKQPIPLLGLRLLLSILYSLHSNYCSRSSINLFTSPRHTSFYNSATPTTPVPTSALTMNTDEYLCMSEVDLNANDHWIPLSQCDLETLDAHFHTTTSPTMASANLTEFQSSWDPLTGPLEYSEAPEHRLPPTLFQESGDGASYDGIPQYLPSNSSFPDTSRFAGTEEYPNGESLDLGYVTDCLAPVSPAVSATTLDRSVWAPLPAQGPPNGTFECSEALELIMSPARFSESGIGSSYDSPPRTPPNASVLVRTLASAATESPMPAPAVTASERRNAIYKPSPSGIRKTPTTGKKGRAEKSLDDYDLSKEKELKRYLGSLTKKMSREKQSVQQEIESAKVPLLMQLAREPRAVPWTNETLELRFKAFAKQKEQELGYTDFVANIERQKQEARDQHNRLTQRQ
jgi:hypothetical protein